MKRYSSIGLAAVAIVASAGWLATARAADDAVTKQLVEYFRRKADVPPSTQIEVKDLKDSKIKGAKTGTLSIGGQQQDFIISDDGRYAAFGKLEDLTSDPFG